MALGKAVHIVRGVKNYDETLPFYKNLGYRVVQEGKSPFNDNRFTLLTDETMNIVLSEDNMTYTGLIYFDPDIKPTVEKLEKQGFSFFWKHENDGETHQAMFEVMPEVFGINLVKSSYDQKLKPPRKISEKLGRFGEFAIPVESYDKLRPTLLKLGFTPTLEEKEPYPWGIFGDGLVYLGVHQTKDFDSITLTYFAKDMNQRIEGFKEKGFEPKELSPGNISLTAPDGQRFYFFTGDIESAFE